MGPPKWLSVAIPREIIKLVREFIDEVKYWPNASSFCREAVLEKLRREKKISGKLSEGMS